MSATLTAPAPPTASLPRRGGLAVGLAVAGVALAVLLAAVHLTQGTAGLGLGDLLAWVTRSGDEQTVAVMVASRVPRLLAGLLVGVALGVAGTLLQSVARNPLASPDTMAVNAGAHLAITAVAAFGLAVPLLLRGSIAFLGGLAAAALVIALSRGGAAGPTRLILAGSAITLALSSVTMVLLVLFDQRTTGLYAWGSGSLTQSGTAVVTQAAPLVLVGVVAALALAHSLDLLALGDDTARVLGLHVVRTRVLAVLVAVFLSAAAVTVAGPVGFVGLCAPVLVRLLAAKVPAYSRHLVRIPMTALAGVLVVLAADVLLRAVAGPQAGVAVPTGLVTSMVGALVLVLMARRVRDTGPRNAFAGAGAPRTTRSVAVLAVVLLMLALVAVAAGTLLGQKMLLGGDVWNWLTGASGRTVTASLNERVPRVLAAALAGGALAIAGTAIQGVARNPLAEPSTLGITAGAGLGAVTVLAIAPTASIWAVAGAGTLGALATFGLVYGLAYRGGLSSDRLVLMGIGTAAGAGAATSAVLIATSPWDLNKALTWLSGTTYGRTWSHLWPLLIVLAVAVPVLARSARRIDLLALDDDVPRVLGVPLERTRFGVLAASVALTVAAVCAVGVVGFVGLVAPHAARALVGSRTSHVLPVAALLGVLLVSAADTLGRTVIAPAQFPAGLVTALIGTPYFIHLLAKTRGRTA